MIARSPRTDTTTAAQSDAPRIRPAVRDLAPSAPALVRSEISDPSGFGFAEPTVQRTPVTVAARRPTRAPQRPPRWPHIAVAITVPAAGVAGFLAAALSSAMPIQIFTFTVVGGVVIVKLAGPVHALIGAIAAVIAKIGSR